jgi:transcriptional regulator with XRE-family HTH domain
MLELAKIREVERLLAEGKLSQRKIAAASGVSRTTIGAIAAGRRPDYEARRLAEASKNEPLGPLARCPECGGLVHTPCRLCRLRKLKTAERQTLEQLRRSFRVAALQRLLQAVADASRQGQSDSSDHLTTDDDDDFDPSDCR